MLTNSRRLAVVLVMSFTMLVSLLVTGFSGSGVASASSYTPTPGCDYSQPHQVSCSYQGVDVLIQASDTGLCFTWSNFGNGQYSDIYTYFNEQNGNGYQDTATWTGPSYTACLNLIGGEYEGYATLGQLQVNYQLVAGSQGAPPSNCPTGITHLASGEPWAVAPMTAVINGTVCGGLWVVTRTGGVYALGAAQWLGDMSGQALNAPMVGIAATPDGKGYWLLGADGGIFSFGDAHFYGSTGNLKLAKPVVGIAATGDGGGYWLVASDGGIFSFGDAHFYGSMGGRPLNKPVVGMASTAGGTGYWLVASDGGIFSFGNAPFYGSLGDTTLAAPIVGMSQQPDGKGYRMVGQDGGVFDFGDAVYYGSLPGEHVSNPNVTTMAASVDGKGYYLINGAGTIWNFGDAPNEGNV